MFNDERITIQSGKIFKKANILAIIISSLFLIARSLIYISTKYDISFGTFGTEICTLLCSCIILIYGEIVYKSKEVDERSITEKYMYYSKKGKLLLIWILVGYAITMIDSFKRVSGDFQPNYILFIFQTIGAIYFYYQFKKNQININYSFINNDNKTYYKHVLKIIGYLAIIVLLIYFTCGAISIIIYQNFGYLLVFLLAAIHSIIGLGLQYLLLSLLEKIDYDDELDYIKKPFFISGMIVSGVLLIQIVLIYITLYIAENGLVSELGKFIEVATTTRNNLSFISTIYGGISLSYLLSYCLKNKKVNKSITLYLFLMVITTIKGIIINLPVTINFQNVEFIQKYYVVITHINNLFNITYILLFGYIVIECVKEKGINKYVLLIPIVKLICFVICIYISTQNNTLAATLNAVVDFVSWFLFYYFIYKGKHNLIKKEEICLEEEVE